MMLLSIVAFGQNNHSLLFDGVDDEIKCNWNNPSSTTFSVSHWAKFTKQTGYGGDFVGVWPTGASRVFLLRYDAQNQSVVFHLEKAANYIKFDLNSEDYEKWMYITATYGRDSMKIYKNGVLMSSKSSPSINLNNGISTLTIGNEENLSGYYKGFLDELSIWNIELSQNKILDLMKCSGSNSDAGLIGLWSFEEGVGVSAKDSSSASNNGNLIGGIEWSFDRHFDLCPLKCSSADTSYTIVQDTLNIYLSSIITSVNDASQAATTVKVYPNPTAQNLTVEIDNPSNLSGVTIKVLDAQSAEVHNEVVTGSTQAIDVSSWSAGVYFLHVMNGSTTVDIKKIVVNN